MTASIWDPSTPAGSTASTVPFTPTATIAADDVQGAVEEADTENRAISALIQAALTALTQQIDYTFARTAAEIAASIVPTNYGYVPGHAYRYGTNTTPGTTDMTAALAASISQAKQTTGADVYWPAGTLSVSVLTADGSGYNIRTAGGRKTILAQRTGTSETTGQILNIKGSQINVGDLAFTGNISTDTLEFHHCVYIYDDAAVATPKDITLGNLYGTDIRGDVLYIGAMASRPCTGIRFGVVSGTNVYRNLLTVAGGEVVGDAVINAGPVGYRDIDVEPNVGGSQPTTLILNYAKIGILQITSDDSALANDLVQIGELDCLFGRIAATTPAFPSTPGTNAQAVQCQYVRLLKIGYFKARDYNYIPFVSSSSSIKSNVLIDVADFSNCCVTETTYNSLFADQGTGGIESLEIGTLIATLFSTTKMVFNSNGMKVRVRRGTVSGGLLMASTHDSQIENLTLDMNSATGFAFNDCDNNFLQNVTFTNASSATGFVNSTNNTLVNVTGTFGTLQSSGCEDNRAVHSTLSGIKYVNDLIGGQAITKAMADANQTLSSVESTAPLLITTGALTAQRNLVVSAIPRIYSVFNNCTGFGVQVIAASGTGIVVGIGKRAIVQYDGTNVVRVTADL